MIHWRFLLTPFATRRMQIGPYYAGVSELWIYVFGIRVVIWRLP